MKKNVLITGANRGLGLGFVKKFLDKDINVFGTTRNISKSIELLKYKEKYGDNLKILELNLLEKNREDTLSTLLSDRPIDIFINNAGMMGSSKQNFKEVSAIPWLEVLQVNLIAPLLITQSIIDNVKKGFDKKIYFLSSRVGSIEDNSGGGRYIYRSSKTALNQVVKSLSIDLKELGITVISLHPGWVRTDMGGPNASLTAEDSARNLIYNFLKLTIKDTGLLFNYDGKLMDF